MLPQLFRCSLSAIGCTGSEVKVRSRHCEFAVYIHSQWYVQENFRIHLYFDGMCIALFAELIPLNLKLRKIIFSSNFLIKLSVQLSETIMLKSS